MRSRITMVAVAALIGALVAVGCLSYADALPGRSVAQAAAAVAPAASVGPGSFQPLNPARLLNTQTSASLKLKPGHQEVTITMPASVPANATSVTLGVIAIRGTARTGYLTVYPTGTLRPAITNVNYAGGQIVNNLATIKLGAGRKVTIFNSAGTIDVIIDLHGYYLPPAGGQIGYSGQVRVSSLGTVESFRTSNGLAPRFARVEAGSYRVTFKSVGSSAKESDMDVDSNLVGVSCTVNPPGHLSGEDIVVGVICADVDGRADTGITVRLRA
ncbi:hypothetical protein [Kribbella sp. NPDC055071]